jgi:hypothetical protein
MLLRMGTKYSSRLERENKMGLTKADLLEFTGTENWYRHSLNRNVTYTDGVKFMAESAGAYWLVDEVATGQMHPQVRQYAAEDDFQVWKLTVNREKSSAVLVCEDGNNNVICSKEIEFTDFPLDEIKLYFSGGVILLPSEY